MSREIEHKYLVISDAYRSMATSAQTLVQGYLCRDERCVVRVRTICADGCSKGFLTVKGETVGDTRPEFEYEIPISDAEAMLSLCNGAIIAKTRYKVPYRGYLWEVDEFDGPLRGLVLAEIELESSNHDYALPPFAGNDVTGDPTYYNSNLCALAAPKGK